MKTKEEILELNYQWLKRRIPNIPEITTKSILEASYDDGFAFCSQRIKELEKSMIEKIKYYAEEMLKKDKEIDELKRGIVKQFTCNRCGTHEKEWSMRNSDWYCKTCGKRI
jgi:hypothetical protein